VFVRKEVFGQVGLCPTVSSGVSRVSIAKTTDRLISNQREGSVEEEKTQ